MIFPSTKGSHVTWNAIWSNKVARIGHSTFQNVMLPLFMNVITNYLYYIIIGPQGVRDGHLDRLFAILHRCPQRQGNLVR